MEGRAFISRIILRLDARKVDLICVPAAAAFFPYELQLRQLPEGSDDALFADPQLLSQRFAREDHEDLAVVIDPSLPAGKLKTVQKKGIGNFGVKTHFRVARIGEEPARHLHIIEVLNICLLHQRKRRPFF